MSWQLAGETGKAMDATKRSLESLNVTSCVVKYQSLEVDTLTWTAATADATGAGTIVPARGQVVRLYQDTTDRRFYGWVTGVKIGAKAVTIEVSNAFWWMKRIYLDSTQTAPGGGTDTRVKYIFATGDLRTSLLALLDRGITNGVPMLRGTGTEMAAMYPFVKATLSNMTIAAALVRMMSRVPDAGTWMDYSDDAALPKLKIFRRNGADATADVAITIGTDTVERLEISPREDLEVARVELPYMYREAVTGKAKFGKQTDGTAAVAKVQIVTISGPEIVESLPKEDFQSAVVTTLAGFTPSAANVADGDSQLAAIKRQYGIQGSVASQVVTYTGATPFIQNFPPLGFTADPPDAAHTTRLNAMIYYLTIPAYLCFCALPAWVAEQYDALDVTISGTWIALWYSSAGPWDAGFKALQAGAVTGAGYFNPYNDLYGAWLARPFSLRAKLLASKVGYAQNPPWTTPTTVYKKWDFDFLNPPAGMAAGLRAAQAWVPWEGEIGVADDSFPTSNELAKTVNVIGSLTECATMRAMQKGLTYDLLRGRKTRSLGAPARVDLGTAMGRVQVNPQDVVEYVG